MQPQRPDFANWMSETNDVTRLFLAAGQIPDIINMAGGLPEPSLYPSDALAEISEMALKERAQECLDYAPIEGLAPLRDLIATRFSAPNLRLSRENILITTGGMQALDLIGKALINPDSPIAVQSPTYLGALDAWRPRRPSLRPFDLGSNDFDATAAFTDCQFAYTVPNFSNPTGRLIRTEMRENLVEAAHTSGTWLIEDDPYGTLYYDTEPEPRLLDLSAEGPTETYNGPVIYLGTLSKELAPGLRIGWVIASPDMIAALTLAKQGSDMSTSGLSQVVTHEALSKNLDRQILPDVLSLYRTRRDALCSALSQHLEDWFDWDVPTGGMFVWATAKDPDFDTDALLKATLAAKTCVTPSSVFDPVGTNKRSIRINFTRNSEERLQEGVKRLATACAHVAVGIG